MRIKLIICTVLFSAFQLAAEEATAQHLTMRVKDASLETVLREFRKQTGYDFLYNPKVLAKVAAPVSVDIEDLPIEAALADIFGSQRQLEFVIDQRTVVIKEARRGSTGSETEPRVSGNESSLILAFQESRGRVVDSLGNPLAGASIRVLNAEGKRTTLQATTDHDGYFVLRNVPEDAVLEVTYVGYVVRRINARADVGALILQAVESELEEVEVMVNTGYQQLPKERATGSFVTIDQDLFNQQVGATVLDRLEGIANGLSVDRSGLGDPQVMIRGTSTIRGERDVLVIVDNFEYNGDLANLNPNDVESVTLLKDAAAASIWGAKSGNGVIVITTKKAKQGQRFKVDFNSHVALRPAPDLYSIPQMSAADFMGYEKFLYDRGYYGTWANRTDRMVFSPYVDLLRQREGASDEEKQAIDRQIGALQHHDVRRDFEKHVYQTSKSHQHALGLSGSSERHDWLGSIGYDGQVDELAANSGRLNLRFQNTFRPLRNLQLIAGITMTQFNAENGRLGYGSIDPAPGFALWPYARLADENGTPLPINKRYRNEFLETLDQDKFLDWSYFPLKDNEFLIQTDKRLDLLLNTGVEYKPFSWLVADVKYQFQRQLSENRDLRTAESYHARQQVNNLTQILPDGSVRRPIPLGGILQMGDVDMISHNIRGQLAVDRQIGRHAVHAILGSEVREVERTTKGQGYYGYNENYYTYGLVDYTSQFPNFLSGGLQTISNFYRYAQTTDRYVSMFGNASYTLDERYILSLSARSDASNLFGVAVKDKWNPFWSAGFSWNIAKEPFFTVDWMPTLRVRSTYGFTGNVDPSEVAVMTILRTSNSTFTGTPMAQISNYPNPMLSWETVKVTNFGVDFAMFGNRLSGSMEYYQKKGINLIGRFELDPTAMGALGSAVRSNVASIMTKGIDIALRSVNVDKAFRWHTTLNFSFNKDEVLENYSTNLTGTSLVSSRVANGIQGMPVNAFFGYRWAGLDPQNGQPRGYLNGEISSDYAMLTGNSVAVEDARFFGSSMPTRFGNLVNTFSYKRITADIGMIARLGYFVRREALAYSGLTTQWRGHSDYANRWQAPGDENRTNVPAPAYPVNTASATFYGRSEVHIRKADHVRLSYVNLQYRVPVNLPKVQTLSCYLNAANLGILWKADAELRDPDVISYGQMPVPATYTFGIRALIN